MYLGEIRMFAGNFAPLNWNLCDGSLLNIAEYDALFSLLGTTYGGDGETTFRLPDMRGRVPIHRSLDYTLGSGGGNEQTFLNAANLPPHTHAMSASSSAPAPATSAIDITAAAAYVPASPVKPRLYAAPGASVAMAAGTVQSTGGSQPHNNMAPYLGINFIICLFGVYPSRD